MMVPGKSAKTSSVFDVTFLTQFLLSSKNGASKLDCMQLKQVNSLQIVTIFFTDVEALEGYADALTEVGGLTPEHHQAIATKLALDLMEDLNIDEKQKSDLLEKETAFIKDAEIAYVRSKCILITGIVVDCVTTIYRQLQV